MATYSGSHSTDLPVAPEEAFAVMTRYEELPTWQGPLKRCAVLNRHDDGLGRDVEYEVDVKLRTVTYTLRHSYDPPRVIRSEYLDGDFRSLEGGWTFEPHGEGATHARFELRIDPGLPVPGPVAKMLKERVLKSAVNDLSKRLESS